MLRDAGVDADAPARSDKATCQGPGGRLRESRKKFRLDSRQAGGWKASRTSNYWMT
jgi:hypothetical protein